MAIFQLKKDWNFVVAVDLKAISFTIKTLDFFSNNKSPVKSVEKRQTVSRETSRQGTDKIIMFAMFINPYV